MKNKFVVIWVPNTFYIFLEYKKNYLRQEKYGVYKNKPIEVKEFDTFEEADKFTDELWKI